MVAAGTDAVGQVVRSTSLDEQVPAVHVSASRGSGSRSTNAASCPGVASMPRRPRVSAHARGVSGRTKRDLVSRSSVSNGAAEPCRSAVTSVRTRAVGRVVDVVGGRAARCRSEPHDASTATLTATNTIDPSLSHPATTRSLPDQRETSRVGLSHHGATIGGWCPEYGVAGRAVRLARCVRFGSRAARRAYERSSTSGRPLLRADRHVVGRGDREPGRPALTSVRPPRGSHGHRPPG